MRGALVVLLLAGCDQLWNIDHVDRTDAQVTVDPDAVAPPPDGPMALACPPSFTYNATTKTFYLLSTTPADWDTARDACRTMATGPGWFTHLAVVGAMDDYTSVFESFTEIASVTPWVGAFDTDPTDMQGLFRWVTDEPGVPTRWGSENQPDQIDIQNCARMWVPDGMDNELCSSLRRYLCECDWFPDAP